MLAAGAVIGAWYACTAALRRLLCAGPLLSLLADLAFSVGAATVFCLALYLANYGSLRLYAVLASALGFTIFAVGIFPPAKSAILACVRVFHRIIVTIREYRWIKVIFK